MSTCTGGRPFCGECIDRLCTCTILDIDRHIIILYRAYLEGGAWVEPDTTSKLLALPHFHIKVKSVLKHIEPISLKYVGKYTDIILHITC